jgi:hypothetical protein
MSLGWRRAMYKAVYKFSDALAGSGLVPIGSMGAQKPQRPFPMILYKKMYKKTALRQTKGRSLKQAPVEPFCAPILYIRCPF